MELQQRAGQEFDEKLEKELNIKNEEAPEEAEQTASGETLSPEERRQRALEEDKQFEQKLEAKEQRQREREARAKERSKQRPAGSKKKQGCDPGDPLCGLESLKLD